jgi:hypothetical protein
MSDEFSAIDKFVEELERLKLAHKLLEELYYTIGNYNLKEILALKENPYGYRQNLSTRIDDYFGFDDSE